MTRVLRGDDPRYVQIVDKGVRKLVRDQVVLADEIMSMLVTYGELTRNRLAVLVSANSALVEQVLTDLMGSGRITRVRRPGPKGQLCFFWSAIDASGASVRFNAAATLAAFQRNATERAR